MLRVNACNARTNGFNEVIDTELVNAVYLDLCFHVDSNRPKLQRVEVKVTNNVHGTVGRLLSLTEREGTNNIRLPVNPCPHDRQGTLESGSSPYPLHACPVSGKYSLLTADSWPLSGRPDSSIASGTWWPATPAPLGTFIVGLAGTLHITVLTNGRHRSDSKRTSIKMGALALD